MNEAEKKAKYIPEKEKASRSERTIMFFADAAMVGLFSLLIYFTLSPLGVPEFVILVIVVVFGAMSSHHPLLVRWPFLLAKKLFRR